jgi:ssRNA-specific RNase YbeY (16S rRNA maturation enzyme)
VNIFFGNEQNEPVDEAALRRFAQIVLEAEGFPVGTEMAVILVDADQMAEYNRRFMDREGPQMCCRSHSPTWSPEPSRFLWPTTRR